MKSPLWVAVVGSPSPSGSRTLEMTYELSNWRPCLQLLGMSGLQFPRTASNRTLAIGIPWMKNQSQ